VLTGGGKDGLAQLRAANHRPLKQDSGATQIGGRRAEPGPLEQDEVSTIRVGGWVTKKIRSERQIHPLTVMVLTS